MSKVFTYPTGLKVKRLVVKNRSGSILLDVEQYLTRPLFGRILDVEVSGSFIPKGATGAICHESLPVKNFGMNWDAAVRFAKKLRDRLASVAK